MPRSPTSRRVAIIGPGRLGQAMGRVLAQAGVPIAFVAARQLAAARRAARFIGQGEPVVLGDSCLSRASVFLITTSDAAIAGVAAGLAGADWKGSWRRTVVLHTCGSLPSSELQPLQRLGAAIGSLHPYQTIPNPSAGVRNLLKAFWAIEGDPPALRVARDWVKRLQGISFPVQPDRKTLYHLSAFLVCPTVLTLMTQSQELLKRVGVSAKIARPMLQRFVEETARNFGEWGGAKALTGPAARGDWATLRRHLAALRQAAPEFVPVYQSLVEAMLRLAGREMPEEAFDSILKAEHTADPPRQAKQKDKGSKEDS